ncbi:TIGR02679 family protein [Ectothiorhodospira mobilis]|uniref:TIGR02679 family protein n=1 Tax=Ectothiorhodospira mobilis TaxID=195064 RepID=UPI00190612B7|nr:TIGR02679 family protein [Ectothiorhodospira mobilis]MBK1691802.1 TIGR02679 family protein [Ectothiorhodospira mobilis]
MRTDAARLQRLLGGPDCERLRSRLRTRLVRGGGDRITLTRSTPEERERIERLLGRPPRKGETLRISLVELEGVLRHAGIAPDLRSALEALDGPIVDPRERREAQQARWAEVVDAARDRARSLGLEAWLEELGNRGLLRRLSRNTPQQAAGLLDRSLRVLEQLPGGGLNRSTLAARSLGDAHGLDSGRPEAALVRRALARHWRGGTGDDRPDERTLWAHAGILVGGDITSTVLILGLPARGDGPTDALLRTQRATGEPLHLTLRQLLRHPPRWAVRDQTLFVCENPTVVAEAAEQLGSQCAPLVCTGGRPGAAVWAVLEQLAQAGARLRIRADFDWTGLSIVNGLMARFPARSWHMDTATLRFHAHLPGPPLEGRPTQARWDPELGPILTARGDALHEEQLLSLLLQDLELK